ncbi:MAG: HEAT repeat domain-containing protein [Elusimicrobia bacterium]|nr:HEAT repeat domain-containing protein [Elusimicrobiota bacterium]
MKTASLALLFSVSALAGQDDAAMVRALLPSVRAQEADLSLRPDRATAPFAVPAVEELLRAPLFVPEMAGAEHDTASASLSDALRSAASSAGMTVSVSAPSKVKESNPPASIKDPALRRALKRLAEAAGLAKALLDAASSGLTPEEREQLASTVGAMARSEAPPSPPEAAFALAARFDAAAVAEAAAGLSQAAQAALPELENAAVRGSFKGRIRWKSPAGAVLLSGAGDHLYGEADLEGAAVVIDLGGRSRYTASPAAAGPGEVRLVVDLSPELSVESSLGGVGAGTFGIGLFIAPAGGSKSIHMEDGSLGAGLFGAGGAFVAGPLVANTGRFSMGAAAFGVGAFVLKGDRARLLSDLGSQGYGFSGGGALFALRGDGARVECGLRRPDGREALAFLSLCQGVGYGPRAFAAGGVGTAMVLGSTNSFRAGYMAQGMGYWHALGRMFVRGDANQLQGRRYAQGAGVHTALGLLSIEGRSNRTRVWGVGPAFGWDYGAGWLGVHGDDNEFASEWASARGDVNGHGFVAVVGDRNTLALAGAAAGALRRNAPSYGLAAALGAGNRLKTPDPDPWGAQAGFELDGTLEAPPAVWPEPVRGPFEEADSRRVLKAVLRAEALPARERLAAWLEVLADAGLESRVPLTLAERVLSDREEAPVLLPVLVTPERFDELVWARLLLSGGGRRGGRAAAAEASAAKGERRVVLAGLLSVFGSDAAEAARGLLMDPDWRVRRAAAHSMGRLLSRETGEEPGRLTLLAAAEQSCGKAPEEPLFAAFGAQSLGAYLQVLSVDPGLPRSALVSVFQAAQGQVLDRLPPGHGAARAFAAALAERGPESCAAYARSRAAGEALIAAAAESARGLLSDREPEVVQAAVTALAQMGRAEDARVLAGELGHPSSLVREAAAAGLGRMGAAGADAVREALASPSAAVRRLGALSAAQSSDAAVADSISAAFKDPDSSVRAAAVAGLFVMQEPLKPRRTAFLEQLKALAAGDDDAGVRAAAERAVAVFGGS